MKKLSVTLSRKELFLGWGYLLLQLFVLPILIVLADGFFSLQLSEAQLNFVLFAVNFIVTTVLLRKLLLEGGSIALLNFGRTLGAVLRGFGLYWAGSFLVGMIIGIADPEFYNVNDASIQDLASQNYTLMLVATVILAPVTEELLYRGVVFGGISKTSRILAYTVTALGFAAIHVVGYIGMYAPMHLILCLLQYIPAGLVLCYTYEKADSIWAPILLHILINSIAMLATG